jgi:hypothetical protein
MSVEAAWLDSQGQVQRIAGEVKRNEAGRLVVERWADGIRRATEVPRDASVDRIAR